VGSSAIWDPVTTESAQGGRNRLDKSSYYTPVSLRNIPEYISGYVDSITEKKI